MCVIKKNNVNVLMIFIAKSHALNAVMAYKESQCRAVNERNICISLVIMSQNHAEITHIVCAHES